MALLAQDVTNLKCIYFKNVNLLQQTTDYGVDCNKETFQTLVDNIYEYLTMLELSGTVCRSLECKILEILDTNTPDTPCVRNVFTEFLDVN